MGDLTRLLKLEAQILWEFLVQELLGPSSLSTVLLGLWEDCPYFFCLPTLSSGQLRLRTRNPYKKKKVDVYVWDVALETAVPPDPPPCLPPPSGKKKTKNLSDDLALNRPHRFETAGPWRKGIWKQRGPLHVGT